MSRLQTSKKRRLAGLCPRCAEPWTGTTHYCVTCTIWHRNRARQRHKDNKGNCTRCLARPPAKGFAYCEPCLPKSRAASIKLRKKYQKAVFAAYGGKCSCCGNPNHRVLQLDHVHNDGAKHRREVVGTMVKWAYLNNFPPTLQLLCANCHHIKTHHEKCLPSDHEFVADDGLVRPVI